MSTRYEEPQAAGLVATLSMESRRAKKRRKPIAREPNIEPGPETYWWPFDQDHVPTTWHQFRLAMRETLTDVSTDRVTVPIRSRQGGVSVTLRLDPVDLGCSTWIGWLVSAAETIKVHATSAGADRWPADPKLVLGDKRALLSLNEAAGQLVVATLRFPTSADMASSITYLLYDELGVKSLSRVEVSVDRPPEPDRLARQRRADGVRQTSGRSGYTQAPELGLCANCGRPLRTKESMRLGYGPECRRKLGAKRRAEITRRHQAKQAGPAAPIKVAIFRQRVGAVLSEHLRIDAPSGGTLAQDSSMSNTAFPTRRLR